jgi:ABC-type polysaccharide/polyol phosphate transport system ATPase subunit
VSASIVAENAGVRFWFDRQGRPITGGVARLRRHTRERFGLRGVSFRVEPGEAVALIGPNGSGKTTLLRLLAGVYEADEGRVEVDGTIGPLLSVNAGLHGQLTGREASLLLSVLAGIEPRRARDEIGAVRNASELGDAFDNLVSSYSQGMRARLGFTTMERLQPTVLLLDEIHQAFDRDFRARLEDSARRLVESGGVVIAAGHDHAALGELCERAILVRDGRLIADGPFETVAEDYERGRYSSGSTGVPHG